MRKLVRQENAQALLGWIKSTDQDFYEIEYSWRKGEHVKRGFFNPDFFLHVETGVIVVEVKGDEELDDPSDENRAKYRAAVDHFAQVNAMTGDTMYSIHFLTPRDYDAFFQFVRDGRANYTSVLDAVLADSGDEDR